MRGVKRLLLWPSRALRALSPYPPDHALARRLNVDVTGSKPPKRLRGPLPWRSRARHAVEAPLEAVLHPGDVLYFPANWAHHTEALVEGEEPGAPPGWVVEQMVGRAGDVWPVRAHAYMMLPW